MKNNVVVCGLHRSGTTFVGEIFKKAGLPVLHEPLNERFGVVDVPIAYPFVERPGDLYANLVSDAVKFSRSWNKSALSEDSWLGKRLIHRIIGNRSGATWLGMRIKKRIGLPIGPVCFKDPFMSLATPWLLNNHNLKIICMVKHPAAVHVSTKKLGWSFDVENLLSQQDLVARYGSDITPQIWEMAKNHDAASIAILWKLMWRVNVRVSDKSKGVKFVFHEALCMDPIKTVSEIFKYFDIPMSRAVADFVLENSNGPSVDGSSQKIHDFRRDSKNLSNAWRKKVDPAELRIISNIIGDEILSDYFSRVQKAQTFHDL